MSRWVSAVNDEMKSVTSPTAATANWAVGESRKRSWVRAMRYTPAVTIVAAWMSAETGVGPAIASGSQVCSGTCADCPTAPPSSRSAMIVTVVEPSGHRSRAPAIAACTSMVPTSRNSRKRPSSMAVSPTRVTTKALRAA